MASKLVLCGSWLAAALAGYATFEWVGIVAEGNYCWNAVGFTMMAVPLAVGVLVLGVGPSVALYVRGRQRIDLVSLLLAGCSAVLVAVEAIVLHIIPMRGE
jgi:hypothetical protein